MALAIASQVRSRPVATRYFFSVLAAFCALLLRHSLSPWLGASNPYHTVWAAVVFVTWYCGARPAVVTTLIGLLGVWYWFLEPFHSFRLQDPKSQITGLVVFGVLSGLTIALPEANRRWRVKSYDAEGVIGEKESEFHLLADSIPEPCWVAHSDGHIFWYNQRWYEYTGTAPEQMEGWGWQSVHDPQILPSVLERWRASLENGQPFEMEFPLRGADGVFRWFLTRVRPLRNREGKVVRWFGTNTNIQQQRELRQSLIEARNELENRIGERTADLEQKTAELLQKATLLDLANDGIFVRSDDKISYWNQGAERLYGWTSGEVLGRPIHEILRTEFPVPLAQVLESDRWEGELRHTRKDGSRITVTSRWTTLRDHDGRPVGWLEINTDITARKRAEEATRRLSGRILTLQDEERRRIARGLHDSLGQYLTALKMNLDQLLTLEGNHATVASECSDIVDKCLTETRTISYLLHPPLLDEAGFGSASRWYVDGFARRSGISVKLELGPESGRLPQDVETALFRTLQEGLTNVHRHSGGTAVDIRLSVNKKEVLLEIKDNGHGIPQESLGRLVEGDAERGVGIAGMRERVRELGGSLAIESDQNGTLLRVAIPIAPTKELAT